MSAPDRAQPAVRLAYTKKEDIRITNMNSVPLCQDFPSLAITQLHWTFVLAEHQDTTCFPTSKEKKNVNLAFAKADGVLGGRGIPAP